MRELPKKLDKNQTMLGVPKKLIEIRTMLEVLKKLECLNVFRCKLGD
jgi:hypothetical protein